MSRVILKGITQMKHRFGAKQGGNMRKVFITISVIILGLAALMLLSTLSACGWDFERLTHPAITNTYEIYEEFGDISINLDTSDVEFIATDESTVRIECNDAYKITHGIRVEEGVLKIHANDERRWYEMMSIIPVSFKVTVFLPRGEWGALNIDASTGDTEISEGFTFASVNINQSTGDITLKSGVNGDIIINTSTGDITLLDAKDADKIKVKSSVGKQSFTNISCTSLESEADTGKAVLENVMVEGKMSIERITGDVTLQDVDAAEIFIETDTGNVKGTILSDKIFIVRTDTGKIDVPKTTSGGVCEITTSTGNIKIEIK